MSETEFDRYAEAYGELLAASLAVTGETPGFFSEYKLRDIAREVAREPCAEGGVSRPLRVCDFGAGIGGSVPFVHKHLPGAELTCVDVSGRSLEVAAGRSPGLATYVRFDGCELPFAAGQFDVTYAACVFHHIAADAHLPLLRELRRTLAPDGRLFVFEHNPWNPLAVRAVASCPFDENAVLIPGQEMKRRLKAAGYACVRLRYRLFFPHALRFLRPIERLLTWLPLGGQYCAIARK